MTKESNDVLCRVSREKDLRVRRMGETLEKRNKQRIKKKKCDLELQTAEPGSSYTSTIHKQVTYLLSASVFSNCKNEYENNIYFL